MTFSLLLSLLLQYFLLVIIDTYPQRKESAYVESQKLKIMIVPDIS